MNEKFTHWHISKSWSLLKKLTGLTMLALLFPLLSIAQYTNAAGGWNGGGTGAVSSIPSAGGGGGGASDIRIGGTAISDRIIVAGGGGGGGYNSGSEIGGLGGGTIGGNAVDLSGLIVGYGGTQSAGGAVLTGWGKEATPGTLGIGGNGAADGSGGGGGGGYYGGGGGNWTGGGGGSSYTSDICSGVTHTQGWQSGNGQVIISGAGFSTQTFNYTGTAQTFVVPAGVTSVAVDISGGSGGGPFRRDVYSNYLAGLGGRVTTNIAVSAGQTLYIYVGARGQNGNNYVSCDITSSVISQTNVSCYGGSYGAATISASGGTGAYTYAWSPSGGSAATATNLLAGTYTCTITSANLCTKTQTVTITQPSVLTATTSQTNVSCNSGANGTATVSISGGTASYAYSWAPSGGTAATATGRTAGVYTCTITDANGCTLTKSFTITQPSSINATTSQVNVSCNGGANGTATVVASGGTGAYTYSWSPSGGTGATTTGRTAGAYTCTITDANSCTLTKSFTITQPSALVASAASQTNVSCNSGSNGAATVSVTGGTTAYTYNWTPGNPAGDGTASVTGLTATTWTCTATDANSCTTTQSFTVTQPAALSLTAASQTNVSCFGGTNGAASVNTATGGTGTKTYNWTPGNPTGDGTVSVTGLIAGTWICTVTDANGCTAAQSFTVTQPSGLVLTPASQTNIACNGGSNGAASVNTATGGTGTKTYNWTPGNPTGDGTVSVTGLIAGTWICTVTDANGCTAAQSFTVTQPSGLVLTPASQTNIACNGGSTGAASINAATGGTGIKIYDWTPGNPTGDGTISVTGLTAGIWTCTATDANGCTTAQSFTLSQPSALAATTSQVNVSCNGGANGSATVVVSGGVSAYTYAWSPSGGTAATTTGRTAGAYTCTISDANGCTLSKSFTFTQPSVLAASGSQTNVSCNGGSNGTATVSASGGSPSYSYSWSPSGGTGATAVGLAAGTYTCTITDANTCQTTKTVTVTQPSVFAINSSQTNVSCNGGSNGTATVSVTGATPSYTYSWSPSGGTGATASGLLAGTYTCTITDANTCQTTKSVTVTQPSVFAVTSSQTNVSCNGGSNGTATVSVTGATPSYTYSWSLSGGTGATASGLLAGIYTCTITDANTCQTTKSVTVTQSSVLAATISQTNESCNGGANGSASVVVSGGVASYSYVWSPSGGTAATASGLSAGAFTCTITDANGCTLTKSFTITQPTALAATTSQTNVSCNGGSNGSASVVVSGGVSTYTYAWSPSGGTAATTTGRTAGAYNCTITDANGCTLTKSFTITQPTALAATTSQTNVSCNGGSNGSASVVVSGGVSTYTYAWSPSSGTAATASGLSAGTFTCTITDANSCTLSKSFTITQPTAIAATASQTNVSCNGGSNGSASVVVSGGVSTYTYAWSPSGGTAATTTGRTAGGYTCTITDANGCTLTKSFTLTQPTALAATTSQTNVSCNGGSNGSASVVVSGGVSTYTYAWSPSGGTAATASGLSAGAFTCTITDANGCTLIKSFTITQPAALAASTSQVNVICIGGNNGSASVVASGGTAAYSYAWTPGGGTAATASSLTAGNYTCTISDANMCSITKSFSIIQSDLVHPVVVIKNVTLELNSTGNASMVSSDIDNGSYDNCSIASMSASKTDFTCANLGANNVTLTVTDASGNSSADVAVVTIKDKLSPVANVPSLPDVTGECSASAIAPTATDNCSGGVTATATVPLSYSVQGSYAIQWTYSDENGNSSTQDQNVIVKDVTAPVADLAVLADVTGECSASVIAPTATDNCTGVITATTADPLFYESQGSYIIHWTYIDGNGNYSTQDQNVIVKDFTAPVADVAVLADVTGECSATAIVPTATDNCAGVLIATTADPFTYDAQGSYVIHWTYSDGNGNSSTQDQNVIVKDVTAPVADVAVLADVTGECSASVIAPTATDNCTGVLTATTADPLTFDAQGSYIIHWIYSDGNGNSSTQDQNVIVKDVTVPVVDLAVLADVTGECSATAKAPTATDNCAGVLTATTADPLTYDTQGSYIIHWTYSDGNGNSSTQDQNVIVKDVTAPVVDLAVLADLTGECSATAKAPTATDNCAGVLTAATADPLTYDTQGSYIIHWTYSDGNGNSSTQDQNVIVADETDPSFACTHDTTVTAQVSVGHYTILGSTYDPESVADNCGIATLQNNVTNTSTLDGATLAVGANVITWTATDEAGNTFTCTTTITVQLNVEIPEFKLRNVSVYPNPSRGMFTLEVPTSCTSVIYDASGRVIKTEKLVDNLNKIDLTKCQQGVYLLKLIKDEQVVNVKLIVE